MTDGIDRLKVLINSSTPIVVMETAEEVHAVKMVREACVALNMATFEWSIADGLLRSGSNLPPEGQKISLQARIDQAKIDQATGWSQSVQTRTSTLLSPGAAEGDRLARAMASALPAGRRRRSRSQQRSDLQHARSGAGSGQHGVDDGGSRLHPERFSSPHG